MYCFIILFPQLIEKKYFTLCGFNNNSDFLNSYIFFWNGKVPSNAPFWTKAYMQSCIHRKCEIWNFSGTCSVNICDRNLEKMWSY